jgi:nitrile hydratase
VRDPRGLLAEFGTMLAPGTAIRVHDSTADLRYMVIPARPDGTEGWSEEQVGRNTWHSNSMMLLYVSL